MGNKKKNEEKGESQIMESDIISSSAVGIGHGVTQVTVVVNVSSEYITPENVDEVLVEGQRLSIPVPSHAPPPLDE